MDTGGEEVGEITLWLPHSMSSLHHTCPLGQASVSHMCRSSQSLRKMFKTYIAKTYNQKVSVPPFPKTEQAQGGALGPEVLQALPRAAAVCPLISEFSKLIGGIILVRCSEVIKAVASLLKIHFLVAYTSSY